MDDRGVSWRTLTGILGLHGRATLVAGVGAFLATITLAARAAAAALPSGFRSHGCGKELKFDHFSMCKVLNARIKKKKRKQSIWHRRQGIELRWHWRFQENHQYNVVGRVKTNASNLKMQEVKLE